MKIILTTIMLLLAAIVYGQTDSTAIKLQQYKDWKEQGLINDKEYETLKKDLLDISTTSVPAKKDTINIGNFKSRAKGQIIGGSFFSAFGIGIIVGGIYKKNHPPSYNDFVRPMNFDAAGYQKAVTRNTKTARGMVIIGSVELVLAAYLFYRAGHNFTLYHAAKMNSTLTLMPNGASITLNF